MAATTMVHVRVDEQIKAQATETLAAMGLSVSDAVRVFLMRVVADKRMPFELKAPNIETRAAMVEADEIARAHRTHFGTAAELFDDLEKNRGK
jgi:DNA-damage-inducible protein J